MTIKRWQIISAAVTVAVGALLHFTYGWSGKVPFVGLLAPVNESTWEHLKMLAIPMLALTLPAYFAYGRNYAGFFPARLTAVLSGMACIVAVFYAYTGILGDNYLPLDIATFILGVIAAYVVENRLLNSGAFAARGFHVAGIAGLLALLAAFMLFTDFPPEFFLFRNPATGTSGRI